MDNDDIYGAIGFIILLILGVYLFSALADSEKLYRNCQETALNRGYPEYELIKGDTVKCYGTNKLKSELLYSK
jgi:uncharacterized protein YpmB